jgi:hypothetical protein
MTLLDTVYNVKQKSVKSIDFNVPDGYSYGKVSFYFIFNYQGFSI